MARTVASSSSATSASLLLASKPSPIKAAAFFSPRNSHGHSIAGSLISATTCLVEKDAADKEHTKGPARSKQQRPPTTIKSCGVFGAAIASSFQSLSAASAAPNKSPFASQEAYTYIPNVLQHLVLADLDPGTAKIAIGITGPVLSAFGFLFILRIVMSWYPKLPVAKFPYILVYAPTEPFLRVTRKVIPPLGGVDVTPVVWFGLVSFLNEILVGPQGLLVLLSQQV